ncbi:hypothetical protein [Pantoea sp. JV6]|uniref:hypothetical protein n=1 Tax=Pantoea sp. JV6 TaxID=2981604 RepID=UPI00221E6F14|nr:hypothetical protein [Pantoea sp. JV6]MCW0974116.1 hypothetical protein [Pantoea sp. JV6]
MTVQRFNPIAAAAIAASPTGKYVLARDYDALLQQNNRMREAIEFAIAPDLWTLICADERAWRYKRGAPKYQDVLRRALEPSVTDTFLNSVRAQAISDALDSCTALCETDCVMDVHDINYEDAELRAEGATELRDELVAYANQLCAGKESV